MISKELENERKEIAKTLYNEIKGSLLKLPTTEEFYKAHNDFEDQGEVESIIIYVLRDKGSQIHTTGLVSAHQYMMILRSELMKTENTFKEIILKKLFEPKGVKLDIE